MVGFDNRDKNLSSQDFVIAGAVSGLITRAICQPLDVVKIRFQLQVEPIKEVPQSKYKSVLQSIRIIAREEGVTAFWKGHISAQYLSITYGFSQFYVFETLTKSINITRLKSQKLVANFLCGSVAGGCATIVSFPFDVIRTRLIAQSTEVYTNVHKSLMYIVKDEGVHGLYRGLTPTVLQVAPHAGIQFMTYKFIDNTYRIIMSQENYGYSFVGSTLAGALSGLVAKTAIYPFDLIKKRLQIQGFTNHRTGFGENFVCRGAYDCLSKIYKHEGVSGLFKGLGPSLLKAIITSALHFNAYEFVCEILANNKVNN